jgi:hypothetical protein
VNDALDDILARLQRVSSEVKHIVEATDPDREARVDPRFLKARVDRWNEALRQVDMLISSRAGHP